MPKFRLSIIEFHFNTITLGKCYRENSRYFGEIDLSHNDLIEQNKLLEIHFDCFHLQFIAGQLSLCPVV